MNRVVFLWFLMSSAVAVKAAVADTFITEGLVAILYSDALFNCNVSGMPNLRWDFKSNFKDIETVFTKDKISAGYDSRFDVTVEEEGSVSGFYIRNVTTQEAGVYNCMNGIGAVKIQATYVTVLHSEPSCYLVVQDDTLTVEEGDTVSIVCNVCYTGEATVDAECLSDREVYYPSLPVKTTSRHNVSCSSYHKTYVTHGNVSESNFTCKVTFYSPTDRVDIYNYTWTSPTLTTNYGPSKPFIVPPPVIAKHNSRLTCSSEGHPEPELEWTSGNTSQAGSEFIVDLCNLTDINVLAIERETTMSVSVRCLAKSKRGNTTASITSTDVKINILVASAYELCYPDQVPTKPVPVPVSVSPTTPPASMLYMYIIIGVCVFVGLVSTIIVVTCVTMKRRRQRETAAAKETPLNVFYNDASGARNPYNILPGTYNEIDAEGAPGSGSRLYGPYDDLDEILAAAAANGRRSQALSGFYEVVVDEPDEPDKTTTSVDDVQPLSEGQYKSTPYQGLHQENRELPAPPTVYNALTNDAVHTSGEPPSNPEPTENVSGSKSKPYEGLQQQEREATPPPVVYRQLNTNEPTTTKTSGSESKPYEGLQQQEREPIPPPVVYRRLNTNEATTTNSIDKSSEMSKPYEDLQAKSREKSTKPPIYSKLGAKKKMGVPATRHVDLQAGSDYMQPVDLPEVNVTSAVTQTTGPGGYLEVLDDSL